MPPELERRQDDRRITELQVAVARVEASIVAIKESRESSHEETVSFRNDLKRTLDGMAKTLADLPCPEQVERVSNIKTALATEIKLRIAGDKVLHGRIAGVWKFIVAIILAVLGSFGTIAAVSWAGGIRFGSLEAKVEGHSESLKKVQDDFHSHEIKDDRRMPAVPAVKL